MMTPIVRAILDWAEEDVCPLCEVPRLVWKYTSSDGRPPLVRCREVVLTMLDDGLIEIIQFSATPEVFDYRVFPRQDVDRLFEHGNLAAAFRLEDVAIATTPLGDELLNS